MKMSYKWAVRESNPGGDEISRARQNRPWCPPSLLYDEYRVSFPKVKRLLCGADLNSLLSLLYFKAKCYSNGEDFDW
jgi:hypothetical protein